MSDTVEVQATRWRTRVMLWVIAVVLLAILATIGIGVQRRQSAAARLKARGMELVRIRSSRLNQWMAWAFRIKEYQLPVTFSGADWATYQGLSPLTPADFEDLRQFPGVTHVDIFAACAPVALDRWPALPPQIKWLRLESNSTEEYVFDHFLKTLEPSPALESLEIQWGASDDALANFQSAGTLQSLKYYLAFEPSELDFLASYPHLKKLNLQAAVTTPAESRVLALRELEELELEEDSTAWLEAIKLHPTLKLVNQMPIDIYLRDSAIARINQ